MNLRIICVGTTRSGPIEILCDTYLKRLRHYGRVDLEILRAASRKGDDRAAQRDEGERLIKAAQGSDVIIALDERGEQITSTKLADKLTHYQNRSVRKVAFWVGGASGLSSEARQRATWLWSFSSLTFPHELVRVLLLEQLYRGFSIIRGEPYHK